MEAAMRKITNWAFIGLLASLAPAAPAAADELSKSIMRPTPVTSGTVAGNLPGGEGATSYYRMFPLCGRGLTAKYLILLMSILDFSKM
jgi:hypothetical protein